MPGQVPWGEACLAMLAMMIVLIFVLIYYCVMPVYHSLKKQKEREEELTYETDPRWNRDTFRYMPQMPNDFKSDKKYSRLAACSRSSSMRGENPNVAQIVVGSVNETKTNNNELLVKPPNYSDLFDRSGSSSLASSPPRYSSKTPSVEISSSNEKIDQKEVVKKAKIIKPKKLKKALSSDDSKKAENTEEKPNAKSENKLNENKSNENKSNENKSNENKSNEGESK